MRVAVFFAYLCFLLLRGEGYAFTAAHHNNPDSPLKNIQHQHRIKFLDTNQDYSTINSPDLEEDCLISEDIDEDDASNFLARKYRLLTSYYLTLTSPDVLSYLYKCHKAPPPFRGQLSDIYITHSVLRI
ncbi:hypothetical protein [Chitinophaga sp.]|uniref:hypothetical protein n=1 Tax=Chitinophaga sp. TaxID=1869181 RepID=UPI002D0025E7|nr:hypothetical protein [Chitinophaga sp.]HWV66816.1 hypothetical protein [Chitinophaga sp.]